MSENEQTQLVEEFDDDQRGTAVEPIEFRDDPIGWLLDYRSRRTPVRIKKKTYLWLCLLGVIGAHRFYAKQYIVGTLYLLLCWTGLSVANTIIDLFVIIPMPTDEEGYMEL